MEEGMSGFYVGAPPPRGGGGSKCGRWNPTAEQVKVLTELFRSGLRTPTTDQIQKISSQLSFYGKIESKNVFYWFQNHKARERQKRRKVIFLDEIKEDNSNNNNSNSNNNNLVPQHKDYCYYSNISSTKRFVESERVKETLQLFPLNSLSAEMASEKMRDFGDDDEECNNNNNNKENNNNNNNNCSFGYNNFSNNPMLDLRLSFL